MRLRKWKKRWKIRLLLNNNTPEKYIKLMRSVNPLVIPRNQKVEESLKVAEQNDLKKINQLLEILNNPYTKQNDIIRYQYPSLTNQKYQTYCGT